MSLQWTRDFSGGGDMDARIALPSDPTRHVTCQICSGYSGKGAGLSETTKQRLLRQAVSLVGMEELAVHLGVPVNLLDAWIRGMASMPDRKFLLLADLLKRFRRPEKG